MVQVETYLWMITIIVCHSLFLFINTNSTEHYNNEKRSEDCYADEIACIILKIANTSNQ